MSVRRRHAARVLCKNPGLQPMIDEATTEAYEIARLEAAAQTLLERDVFHGECPHSWNQITDRSISWPRPD